MSSHNTLLPQSDELNIPALSRLFSNTTNSYKLIFFLSLLDVLRRKDFQTSAPISLREMSVEMMANAWYPHTYFKLSFGLQDRITSKLDFLDLDITEPILKFRDADKKLLRSTIEKQELDDSLMRYVPYRILRPFFEEKLRGVPEYKVDAIIERVA